MNTRKNLLASTIAFFMGSTGAANVVGQEAGGGQETEGGFVLEEIVVTASKRETSLQDTAMSISAIGGEAIDKRNFVGRAPRNSRPPQYVTKITRFRCSIL